MSPADMPRFARPRCGVAPVTVGYITHQPLSPPETPFRSHLKTYPFNISYPAYILIVLIVLALYRPTSVFLSAGATFGLLFYKRFANFHLTLLLKDLLSARDENCIANRMDARIQHLIMTTVQCLHTKEKEETLVLDRYLLNAIKCESRQTM